jgi:anti-sigma B factor antagonist
VNEAEKPEVHVISVPGQRSGVQILKISGPLTIRDFFEFQQMARDKNAGTLVVDFTDVPYIDSAALGSLVGIHVSCEKDKRKYALAGINSRIRTVLEVSHVDEFLITFPTVADAEAALA